MSDICCSNYGIPVALTPLSKGWHLVLMTLLCITLRYFINYTFCIPNVVLDYVSVYTDTMSDICFSSYEVLISHALPLTRKCTAVMNIYYTIIIYYATCTFWAALLRSLTGSLVKLCTAVALSKKQFGGFCPCIYIACVYQREKPFAGSSLPIQYYCCSTVINCTLMFVHSDIFQYVLCMGAKKTLCSWSTSLAVYMYGCRIDPAADAVTSTTTQ